jgi:hypothetical protein
MACSLLYLGTHFLFLAFPIDCSWLDHVNIITFTYTSISFRKDESCAICGNTSALCMDNNCGTAIATCNAANADPTLCLTRINVAFSGTDKNSVSFSSWMTINSVNKYSLSALYSEAGTLLQQGAASIIGSSNGVGTGGQS